MFIKRVMSLIIGFIAAICIILFTNKFVVNTVISGFIIIAIYELDKAFKSKDIKPLSIISYITTVLVYALNTFNYLGWLEKINITYEQMILYVMIPIVLILTFISYILKHHKYNIVDVAVTLLQIVYCVFMFNFISGIYSLENGKIYIWYAFIGSWFTDIFAYCVGRTIGKHTFTSISPKKTIEGCIGGILGAVISFGVFTYILNTNFSLQISYLGILILAAVCSIISQLGDLFASSIKRYVGIKDFGNVFPGHGGMIDRFDSTIFVAPIVFMYFCLLI